MTQQSESYGYQSDAGRTQAEKVAEQVTDTTRTAADKSLEFGQHALDRVDEWMRPVGLSIKERPMTCLAVVGGIAFAAGALWMLRPTRRHTYGSYGGDLMSQLSDYARQARRNFSG